MSSEYAPRARPVPVLNKKPKRIVIIALVILLISLSTSVLPALLRSGFPGVHPVAAANNALGVVCGYGASTPGLAFPTPIQAKDGDTTTLNSSCEWAGDIDGDGAFDPLVADNPSLLPGAGGGFIADIVVTNLNTIINGFDLTISYNTTVLNAVSVDQSGLTFGGNVGCLGGGSCTLDTTPGNPIDNTAGTVRLVQALLATTLGPGGSCNTVALPSCASPNQELFRIRFDVVGTGRAFINFSTDPVKNVIVNPGVVDHTSQDGVLSTDALFNLLNGQTTGAFNQSWTFSAVTPGSSISFTAANTVCTYCTGPFTYNWDFSSQDSATYVAKIDATGKTVTITPPPPVIYRVTLTVTDSAVPAHSVFATRNLPLKAAATGPITAAQSVLAGPFSSKWLGGIVTLTGGYSGQWRFCAGSPVVKTICSNALTAVSQAPPSITQTSSVASVSWNFAGLYNSFFTISDTAVSQISATANAAVVPVPINITGVTPAYAVSITSDKTTINAGQTVTFSVTVTYAATYPAASKSSAFSYAFDFGDGSTDTISAGLTATETHTFNTGGSFIVKVVPRETSASAQSQIQENGYTPAITVIPPLAASFTFSPSMPTSGQTVTFTSTVTGGNPPYTFAWDFGDTGTSTLANPTHVFTTTAPAGADFTVKMTVTDSTTPTPQSKAPSKMIHVGPAAFDFSLGTPSPSSITVTQGTTSTSSSIIATLASGTTAPVMFSASGLPSGVIAIFTNNPCSPTCTVTVSFSATATATLGTATISIDASGGGAAHSIPLSLTVQAPTQAPTVIVNAPTPNPANTGATVTVTFTVSSTATVTGITVDWGDGSTPDALAGTATSDIHVYASTGATTSHVFTIKVTATNSAGPGSGQTTETIDDRVPTVSVTSVLPDPATTGQPVTITFTATDPDGIISSFTVNWGDGSPVDTLAGTATSDMHTYTVANSYMITVIATDNSGSTGQNTGSVVVQAPVSVPSVTVNTPTPDPADTGTIVTVTFTFSSTAPVTQITVNWGDGTINSLASSATSDMHSYTSTGASKSQIFTIVVTATNSAGPGAGQTTETINDRVPTVTVTNVSPNPALTGQQVAATFTAADPDGTVSSISVNWGDGTTPSILPGTATSDTHTYTIAGPFAITITATDNSGSTGQGTGSIMVNVPVGVPTVTVSSPTPNPANTGATVTVAFTVSSTVTVTGITIDWGDGTVPDSLAGTATSGMHTYSSTGATTSHIFTIKVTATNSAGQGSGQTTETVNDRPPTVTISSVTPPSPTVGQPVTVSFTTSDPDGTVNSISVDWGDGTTPDALAGTATSDIHTYTVACSCKVTITATDNSGSTGQATTTITTVVPVGVPTVTVNTPTPNPADTGTPVTVSFTVSSTVTVTGITVDWGDGTTADILAGTATSDMHTYASTGTSTSHVFTITVTATNSAGPGTGQTTETINDRPPGVTISNVAPNPANTGQMVTVTFTTTDPDGTVSSITVDWGDGPTLDVIVGTATSDVHTYTAAGSFTITVTATDNSGSTGHDTRSIIVNVPVGVPTVTVNSPTPNPADTGATVTVTFTVTSTATVTGINVDWGDATTPDALAGTATSAMHAYSSTGNVKSQQFTITVTATNSAGSGSGHTTETINDRAPVASFAFNPTSPSAGQTVNFDASASVDPDGTITSYAWDFGDGTTGTGVTTTHTYNPVTNTSFTVKLTVTDNSGSTGTVSHSVTVTVPLKPPTVTITNVSPNPANTGQTVTVSFTVTSTATVTSVTVNWGDGTKDNLTGTPTSDTHAYNSTGSFTITVTATNSAGPGSATVQETVNAVSGQRIMLTFQAFDIDDCDNNIGQLNVLVNNNLVVNLPPCPQANGDNSDFMNKFVSFGPFDITSFVVQGENTLVFDTPPPGHFGLIFNVTISQGDTVLLHVKGPRFVGANHPVSLTFSNPPLTVTSFTVSPAPVVEGAAVTFTATFTGGTGPFTCMFTFGDGAPAVFVTTSSGTCSATHTYTDDGVFSARVKITGQATSDVVRVPLQVNVQTNKIDP